MKKYRKKPVVIEAALYTGHNGEQLASWCGGSTRGVALPPEEQEIAIQTLEGEMRATVGDYIIKGVKGEFYPCKPDIFEASYDEVQ